MNPVIKIRDPSQGSADLCFVVHATHRICRCRRSLSTNRQTQAKSRLIFPSVECCSVEYPHENGSSAADAWTSPEKSSPRYSGHAEVQNVGNDHKDMLLGDEEEHDPEHEVLYSSQAGGLESATATFVVPANSLSRDLEENEQVVIVGDYLCGWDPLKGLSTERMSVGGPRGSNNRQAGRYNESERMRGAFMDAYVGVFRGMIPGLMLKFKVVIISSADGAVTWEPGPDRCQMVEDGKTFTCDWGQTFSTATSVMRHKQKPPVIHHAPIITSPPQQPIPALPAPKVMWTSEELVSLVLSCVPGLSRVVVGNSQPLSDQVLASLTAGAEALLMSADDVSSRTLTTSQLPSINLQRISALAHSLSLISYDTSAAPSSSTFSSAAADYYMYSKPPSLTAGDPSSVMEDAPSSELPASASSSLSGMAVGGGDDVKAGQQQYNLASNMVPIGNSMTMAATGPTSGSSKSAVMFNNNQQQMPTRRGKMLKSGMSLMSPPGDVGHHRNSTHSMTHQNYPQPLHNPPAEHVDDKLMNRSEPLSSSTSSTSSNADVLPHNSTSNADAVSPHSSSNYPKDMISSSTATAAAASGSTTDATTMIKGAVSRPIPQNILMVTKMTTKGSNGLQVDQGHNQVRHPGAAAAAAASRWRLVAAVLCGCSRWIQAMATDARLCSVLVDQPLLATAAAREPRLALALTTSSALLAAVSTQKKVPAGGTASHHSTGLGTALARQPLLVEGVCAEDGRLAAALAASPALAAAVSTDPVLSLVLCGAGRTNQPTPSAADGSSSDMVGDAWPEAEHSRRLAHNKADHCNDVGLLLAERLARDLSLLQALTPRLTKCLAASPPLTHLLTHAPVSLVHDLAAHDAALAAAACQQPVLVTIGLTAQQPHAAQLAALLGNRPRLCAAAGECSQLAQLLASSGQEQQQQGSAGTLKAGQRSSCSSLCAVLTQFPGLADAVESNRSLQRLLALQGPAFLSALTEHGAAFFHLLATNADLPAALLDQAATAAAAAASEALLADVNSSSSSRPLLFHETSTYSTSSSLTSSFAATAASGIPSAGPAILCVASALSASDHAVRLCCHSPDLLRLCLRDTTAAHAILGSAAAAAAVAVADVALHSNQLHADSHDDDDIKSLDTKSGQEMSVLQPTRDRQQESLVIHRPSSQLIPMLLADNPDLCQVVAKHPGLVVGADPLVIKALTAPYAAAAAAASYQAGRSATPHASSSSLPLVQLLVSSPAMAAAAAAAPDLYRVLAVDPRFTASLLRSSQLVESLVASTPLMASVVTSQDLRVAVCGTPELAATITSDEKLYSALVLRLPSLSRSLRPPAESSAGDSVLASVDSEYNGLEADIYRRHPQADFEDTVDGLDIPGGSSIQQLHKALAASTSLCVALVHCPHLCSAVATRPDLATALSMSRPLAKAVQKRKELAEALAVVPELADAVVLSRRLADALGAGSGRNALADLVCLDLDFAELLGSSPVLVSALIQDPRLAALMTTKEGQLATCLCENPSLAQELAANTTLSRLLVENQDLAQLVSNSENLVALLLISDFVEVLAESRDLQGLLSDAELGADLLRQRPLMEALWNVPGLSEALADNPDLAKALVKTPALVQFSLNSQQIFLAIANSTELTQLLLQDLRVSAAAATAFNLYTEASKSQYLNKLGGNKELVKILVRSPGVLASITTDVQLRDLIIGDIHIGSAIVACPKLAEVLAFDDRLVAAVLEHRPGLPEALAAGGGKLATAVCNDVRLAKSLARDKLLAAALAAPESGQQLALALAASPDLASAVEAQTETALVILDKPSLVSLLATTPSLFKYISTKPKLAAVMADSRELREMIHSFPTLLRSLGSEVFVSELCHHSVINLHKRSPSDNDNSGAIVTMTNDEGSAVVTATSPPFFDGESGSRVPDVMAEHTDYQAVQQGTGQLSSLADVMAEHTDYQAVQQGTGQLSSLTGEDVSGNQSGVSLSHIPSSSSSSAFNLLLHLLAAHRPLLLAVSVDPMGQQIASSLGKLVAEVRSSMLTTTTSRLDDKVVVGGDQETVSHSSSAAKQDQINSSSSGRQQQRSSSGGSGAVATGSRQGTTTTAGSGAVAAKGSRPGTTITTSTGDFSSAVEAVLRLMVIERFTALNKLVGASDDRGASSQAHSTSVTASGDADRAEGAAAERPSAGPFLDVILSFCCEDCGYTLSRLKADCSALEGDIASRQARDDDALRKKDTDQAAAAAAIQRLRTVGIMAAVAGSVGLSVAAYQAILTIPEAQEQLNAELQNDVTALYSELVSGGEPRIESLLPLVTRGVIHLLGDELLAAVDTVQREAPGWREQALDVGMKVFSFVGEAAGKVFFPSTTEE
ncbi:hypothetical protein CEUSTIGMA_g1777.t1 [Chlamydomonas eustigma]|uniref:CBM20 domain-containing protein n=1 Tax=Chlamydomonas eustigma TaxID=1157962 RepID=A0A250WU18_9CHLO|nr:hypothetical protein CEUSTIGMA_g1777.t1 [Chlamydomonas eustigma]|eukprot:GAX74328.1 hypothetical protein CEUSTIGMA_g1777.t1 [Chlamydomonas eustigma]